MKCKVCGKECLSGEQTCQKCGTSLDIEYNYNDIDFVFDNTSETTMNSATDGEVLLEDQSLKKSTKHHHKKVKLVIGGVALVIVIFFAIYVIKPLNHNVEYPYVPMSQNSLDAFSFLLNGKVSTALIRQDGKVAHTIDDAGEYFQNYSLSREVVALIKGSNKELCLAISDDLISIDSGVESYEVSQDGSNVAYITGVGELYLYDVDSKVTTQIASDLTSYDYQLSPDGDSIIYSYMEGVQLEVYVSVDMGKPKKITSWEIPVGISNHGEFLYLMGADDFHVITGEKDIRLGDKFNIEGINYKFNLDYTQVLYPDDGKSYLFVEGTVKKLTDNLFLDVLLPTDASVVPNNSGTSKFVNHIVKTEDGVYYLNDKYELNYICQNADNIQVSKDMKSLLVLEGDELHLYRDFQNKKVTRKSIGDASNIMCFKASSDFSIIYYENNNYEFYSVKEDGKAIKLADDVDPLFSISNIDDCCYYITYSPDSKIGNLYYSKHGEAGRIVSNLEQGVLASKNGIVIGVLYREDGYIDLYSINNGKAKLIFSKIGNNVIFNEM